MKELPVNEYHVHGNPLEGIETTLKRSIQRDGSSLWKIKRGSLVLGRDGWEVEPIPSSRTDAFLGRTRFDTPKEAYAHWKRSIGKSLWVQIQGAARKP